MAKQIVIDFKGNSYTLCFTRRTVELMERQEFNVTEIDKSPLTMFTRFFHYAFLAEHKNIRIDLTTEILDNLANKEELWKVLMQMYTDTVNSLLTTEEDSNNGDEEKKAQWVAC